VVSRQLSVSKASWSEAEIPLQAGHQASSIQYQASSIKHPASSIKHPELAMDNGQLSKDINFHCFYGFKF